MAAYNARFAKPPRSTFDAHRPLRDDEDLDAILTWRVTRKVSDSLTLQNDRVIYLLDNTKANRRWIGRYLEVWEYPDGRIEIRADGVALRCRRYDKLAEIDQGAIIEHKRLGPHTAGRTGAAGAARQPPRIGLPVAHEPGHARTRKGPPARHEEAARDHAGGPKRAVMATRWQPASQGRKRPDAARATLAQPGKRRRVKGGCAGTTDSLCCANSRKNLPQLPPQRPEDLLLSPLRDKHNVVLAVPPRVTQALIQLRSRPPNWRAIVIALFPLMYPTTFDTAYFGGILRHICT